MNAAAKRTKQARTLDALASETSALRDRGVTMMAEFLLDRRVAELVDVEALIEVSLASLSEDNVTRIVAEHIAPAWDRHRTRAEVAKETVADALPKAVQKQLVTIAAKTAPPPAAWAKGAVDPKLVRELFAPVLQNTLLAFARRLPLTVASKGDEDGDEPGGGRLGGIADRLKKGAQKRAEQLASVGKSVVGTIGAELDKRLADTAKDFSTSAQRELRDALRERLDSKRGRELAETIRQQLVTRVLETEVGVLMREVELLPRADLEALVGPALAHNALRAFWRTALDEEIRAALDIEGDKTLRSLAEELGVVDEARSALERTLDGLARELFSTRAFNTWLGDVLSL